MREAHGKKYKVTPDEMLVRRQNSRQIEAVGIPAGNGQERIVFLERTKQLREEREEVGGKNLIFFENQSGRSGGEEEETLVDGGKGER